MVPIGAVHVGHPGVHAPQPMNAGPPVPSLSMPNSGPPPPSSQNSSGSSGSTVTSSNKSSLSVVRSKLKIKTQVQVQVFKAQREKPINSIVYVLETELCIEIHLSRSHKSCFGGQIQSEWRMAG